MSFILDALKRADQDRALATPASLGGIYAPGQESSRSVSRSAWLIALVVITAAVFLLIWRLDGGSRDLQAIQQERISHPVVEVRPEPPALPVQRIRPEPPVSVEPLPRAVPPAPPARVRQPVPSLVSPSDPDDSRPILRDLVPRAPRVEPASLRSLIPAKPVPVPRVEEKQPPARGQVVVADHPLDASSPAPGLPKVAVVERAPAAVEMPTRVDNAVVDPAKESAEYDSLPLVFELNAAQQKQYLPLRLDAHVYSTDPGKRFVVLNGKRYAEGDITEAKLLIHKIIREGVVFSKDDRSFRVLR
ncbi:MAG: general secretion pathway protein GspB [Chromatiales bacterium]|nr:general secretion pathway protein GspB [Chromatiales bacterium]